MSAGDKGSQDGAAKALRDQVPPLALAEVHQERDEPRVVGAPADDAVAHGAGEALHGLAHEAQHGGAEVRRQEHASNEAREQSIMAYRILSCRDI